MSNATPEKSTSSWGYRLNVWLYQFSKNWLYVFLAVLGTYATLPWVAPVLANVGLTGPANAIYTIYSPMCHQLGFRSVWLGGDQLFYPREIVGVETIASYEDYAATIDAINVGEAPDSFEPEFWLPARQFRGNETMGYKTAICARDVAIYAAMFIGSLIYAIPYVRRRLRPIPILLYLVIGMGPIGIDGFSQLLSYPPFEFWDVRETAPFFRVATGAMFGLMNAWLALPYIEMSFADTRRQLAEKFRKADLPIPQ